VTLRRWALLGASGLLLGDSLALMALGYFSMGVTVPGALGFAGGLLAWRWHPVHAWLGSGRWRRRLWQAGWLALAAWMASVAVFCYALARQVKAYDDAAAQMPLQAIVVLGSGTPRGQPSPALRARLDKARAVAAIHPTAWVVVSGGVDFGETLSEGQVMGDYLRAHGVAPGRILQEERSTSTELNLQYSLPLLQAHGLGLNSAIALVTSDFHTVRAQRIARKIGYTRTIPAAAPTPLYIRCNAWLREYFATASSWMLNEV
jgi:uncharacterized SAM-binding protein YcdF (DUF218 family)